MTRSRSKHVMPSQGLAANPTLAVTCLAFPYLVGHPEPGRTITHQSQPSRPNRFEPTRLTEPHLPRRTL